MKNNKIAFFILLITFCSSFARSSAGRFEKKKFGSYTVSLSQNFDTGLAKAVIKQRGKNILKMSEIGDHYYFGNSFDETLKEKDPHSGKNITGNGIPNLVLSNWTGGVHCCNFLHIFEIGKKFRKLVTVEANSSSVRLVDLDQDGFPEIEFEDGAIDYLFASFAFSPSARVVLKFKKDHYEVASQFMKRPSPTQSELNRIRVKIRTSFAKDEQQEIPYDFLKSMMDLSYTGHLDLAIKLASEEWPPEKSGLAEFKEQFLQALQNSMYWRDFQQNIVSKSK